MYSKLIVQILILTMFVTKIFSQDNELNNLIADAIKVSPELKVLQSKLAITKAKIDQDSNMPDPMLTLGLMNMPTNSFSFTQEPMSGKMIGLTQKIPFPSGLSASAEFKSVDTLIVKKEIEEFKNKIKNDVSLKYYDLRVTREKIKIVEKSKILFRQASAVIKEKYKTGLSTYQSVMGSEIRLTEIDDQLIKLKFEEKSRLEELNIILFRDLNSPVITENVDPIELKLDKERIFQAALKSKPSINRIKLAQNKAVLQEQLADYSNYPDFQLGLQYTQRAYNKITGIDYNDFLSVIVGVTLPLNYGGKNTARIEEAKQSQNLFAEEYNSKKVELKQTINKIYEKMDVLIKRKQLFEKDLIPQSKEAYSSSLYDFKVDQTDFTNVIKAQNDLLNIELKYVDIINEYYKSISDLEYQIGADIYNVMEY